MPYFELARTNIEPESNCHGKAVMNGLVELCLTLLEVTKTGIQRTKLSVFRHQSNRFQRIRMDKALKAIHDF